MALFTLASPLYLLARGFYPVLGVRPEKISLSDAGLAAEVLSLEYLGADSLMLLGRVAERIRLDGYRIVNVDATVVAQAPRLAPHIPAMQANLAPILGLTPAEVNIKATTTEHMGFAGRGEGIAAYAVVLVMKT